MKNSSQKALNKKSIYFKKVIVLATMIVLTTILSACNKDIRLAYFADGTSDGSDNYTINIDFVDDKRFEKNYADILLKSNIANLKLNFKKEFDENLTITLAEKDRWYSLTNLIVEEGSEEEYETLKEIADMTLVMKSEQDAKLTLKAVCGNKYTNSQGKDMLVNITDISDEFEVDLGKNIDK